MNFDTEITRGIAAHKAWKTRLCVAIATGTSEHTVEKVCRDDQCVLGRWLHGLDEETKATHRWQWVRAAHADFHQEAARVLELALEGSQNEARRAISYSSRYEGISAKLKTELVQWKQEVSRAETLVQTVSPV